MGWTEFRRVAFDRPAGGHRGEALKEVDEALRRLGGSRRSGEPGRENDLYCLACGHRVTAHSAAISIAGSQEHRHTNPQGRRFHIGCFRNAPGCREIGPATGEHSWFPGYHWRVAFCAHCHVQLGWGFGQHDGRHFFGLILARLRNGA